MEHVIGELRKPSTHFDAFLIFLISVGNKYRDIHTGHYYELLSRKQSSVYYKCIISKCAAKLTTNNGNNIATAHNHTVKKIANDIKLIEFEKSIKEEASKVANEVKNPAELYNEILEKFPGMKLKELCIDSVMLYYI